MEKENIFEEFDKQEKAFYESFRNFVIDNIKLDVKVVESDIKKDSSIIVYLPLSGLKNKYSAGSITTTFNIEVKEQSSNDTYLNNSLLGVLVDEWNETLSKKISISEFFERLDDFQNHFLGALALKYPDVKNLYKEIYELSEED